MDKKDISEIIKAAAEALDLNNFKGDVVIYKHVEKEMNVSEGGIGEKHIHHHYTTEQSYAESSRLVERPHEDKRVNSNLCVSDDEAPSKENELCITLNKQQRDILNAAVKEGIIVYNPERKGYDTGHQSSKVLVAYLCGRLFCKDTTDEHGSWVSGLRFDVAQYCKELFGFDVDGARRKARGKGAGQSPTGHERVDKLFI